MLKLRVALEVGEPFELIADRDDLLILRGLLELENPVDPAPLVLQEGTKLRNRRVRRMLVRARYTGDSLAALEEGKPLMVTAVEDEPRNDRIGVTGWLRPG